MSIFSRMRKAKKAASDHKSGKAAGTDDAPAPVPYKHIPTHAATDALAGAPPGWNDSEDKQAIKAQQKRRSNLSRATSGLSVVTTAQHGSSAHLSDWTTTTTDQRKPTSTLQRVVGSQHDERTHLPQMTGNLSPTNSSDNSSSANSSYASSSRGSSYFELQPGNRRGQSRPGLNERRVSRISNFSRPSSIQMDRYSKVADDSTPAANQSRPLRDSAYINPHYSYIRTAWGVGHMNIIDSPDLSVAAH